MLEKLVMFFKGAFKLTAVDAVSFSEVVQADARRDFTLIAQINPNAGAREGWLPPAKSVGGSARAPTRP